MTAKLKCRVAGTTQLRTLCCGAYDTDWDSMRVCRQCEQPDPMMVDMTHMEVLLMDLGLGDIPTLKGGEQANAALILAHAKGQEEEIAKLRKEVQQLAKDCLRLDGEREKLGFLASHAYRWVVGYLDDSHMERFERMLLQKADDCPNIHISAASMRGLL